MSVSKEQLQKERKRYEGYRTDALRILEGAPDSELKDTKLDEVRGIDAAIADIDEALAREPMVSAAKIG